MLPKSAYIHVPFCVHRCGYCDFTVVAGRDDLMGAYLAALELELKRELKEPHPVQTLFLGGGTPTHLPPHYLQQLLELLQHWLPVEPAGELSVEANPASFDRVRMDVLYAAGVHRISLGVQSFQTDELQVLERDHKPRDVLEVVANLRLTGFDNISIDLIYGVPGQSYADWEHNLSTTIALSPQHVSTYGLTFEKGTTYWGRLLRGDLQRADEELERSMYGLAMQRLPEHGFAQYELSNYAQPGRACQHNQVYWRAEPYFGFGPGAASFDGQSRQMRHRSVTNWMRRTLAGESGIMETELLTPELRKREAVMLGLRQTAGILMSEYAAIFGTSIRGLAPEAYDRFLSVGWLEETNGHLRLTPEGRFVADTVMSEFLI